MSVLVRLVLLAGAAAALSLLVREPIASRVSAKLAPHVAELASASRQLLPAHRTMPSLPSPSRPAVTTQPIASHTPVVPTPLPKKHAAKPVASTPIITRITRKELEDAIASRLDGARATLVRDDAGHPLGLRLAGVGKLAPFGVRDGDVLVSANGMPLRTSEEALAALGKLQDAKKVVVVLRRGDTAYSIPVELVN